LVDETAMGRWLVGNYLVFRERGKRLRGSFFGSEWDCKPGPGGDLPREGERRGKGRAQWGARGRFVFGLVTRQRIPFAMATGQHARRGFYRYTRADQRSADEITLSCVAGGGVCVFCFFWGAPDEMGPGRGIDFPFQPRLAHPRPRPNHVFEADGVACREWGSALRQPAAYPGASSMRPITGGAALGNRVLHASARVPLYVGRATWAKRVPGRAGNTLAPLRGAGCSLRWSVGCFHGKVLVCPQWARAKAAAARSACGPPGHSSGPARNRADARRQTTPMWYTCKTPRAGKPTQRGGPLGSFVLPARRGHRMGGGGKNGKKTARSDTCCCRFQGGNVKWTDFGIGACAGRRIAQPPAILLFSGRASCVSRRRPRRAARRTIRVTGRERTKPSGPGFVGGGRGGTALAVRAGPRCSGMFSRGGPGAPFRPKPGERGNVPGGHTRRFASCRAAFKSAWRNSAALLWAWAPGGRGRGMNHGFLTGARGGSWLLHRPGGMPRTPTGGRHRAAEFTVFPVGCCRAFTEQMFPIPNMNVGEGFLGLFRLCVGSRYGLAAHVPRTGGENIMGLVVNKTSPRTTWLAAGTFGET